MNDASNLAGPKGPRFIKRATRGSSSAHLGIDSTLSDDGPVVLPRYSARAAGGLGRPFALPPLPGATLDRMCATPRCQWRGRQVCGCWALYLKIRRRHWIPMLPPQWCDDDGARVSLTIGLEPTPARSCGSRARAARRRSRQPMQICWRLICLRSMDCTCCGIRAGGSMPQPS